jgi:hypothetical protein
MVVRHRLRRRIFAVSAFLVVAGTVAVGVALEPKGYWPIVVASVLGVLLAVAELVARYRDDPAGAVLSLPAAVYLGVNAAGAGSALYLIHVFNWKFGATGSALIVIQVLTAGFGSAALFRTSFFNVLAGDRIIGIGPSEILNVILAAADRAVDRQRALIRASRAAEIMQGLSFVDTAETILAYCVATMQNITPDEARTVEAKISALRDPRNNAVHDAIKSYILGLSLLTLVGDDVLSEAITQLKAVLPTSPHPEPIVPKQATPGDTETAILRTLEDAKAAIPLQELRKQVKLKLEDMPIIYGLQQRGLVAIEGQDGSETIRLSGIVS